jgi:hypothetical protein
MGQGVVFKFHCAALVCFAVAGLAAEANSVFRKLPAIEAGTAEAKARVPQGVRDVRIELGCDARAWMRSGRVRESPPRYSVVTPMGMVLKALSKATENVRNYDVSRARPPLQLSQNRRHIYLLLPFFTNSSEARVPGSLAHRGLCRDAPPIPVTTGNQPCLGASKSPDSTRSNRKSKWH